MIFTLDIPTRTFTEHHIHNDYGFLTVDVIEGKIPQWVYDEVGTKLPKHPRLRLDLQRQPRYEERSPNLKNY